MFTSRPSRGRRPLAIWSGTCSSSSPPPADSSCSSSWRCPVSSAGASSCPSGSWPTRLEPSARGTTTGGRRCSRRTSSASSPTVSPAWLTRWPPATSDWSSGPSPDSLTGLANRPSFEETLADLCERPQQYGVLFVDLDDFKVVNDTMGHAAGDHLLQLVADRLVGAVRADDVVARLGGDEFAVILRAPVPAVTAMAVAARVLE
ncbi:MAG: GGDEF domain-containing protein, partial [Actinomycetota bacterium]|nr:GGDEF domain-containing protein [Actinomycetota bacterium]